MTRMNEERYKSLLIVNESSDAQVTLYLYPQWDFLCWISFTSKIIKPNQKYLHRSDDEFNFELVAKFEDNRPKKILRGPEEWVEDKLLKITKSFDVIEGKLADFPEEKTVCFRRLQRDKELNSTNGRRNLYEILGLNMDEVRKMPKEEQIKAIKKGFHREIQRWHPDKNFGNDENAKEIIMAHEILLDDEKRARYHNEADYDAGWLSLKRYKAIFKPECFSEEQKTAYRHRMFMFALSVGVTIGGIGLTVGTAGAAAPAVIAIGGVFGGGFIGGGLQSLQHTLNRGSVVDECDKKKWLLKAGIGFVGGAVTGGAAVGITAGVAGLGSAAAAVTTGQFVGTGAASGAVGGVASSLASDTARKLVDGENVTWKQFIGHAACGAAIGAAAGAIGGAVTKQVVAKHTTTASADLNGEIGEQIAVLSGARRLQNTLARNISRAVTENGTESVMGSVAQFAEERLDDSVENRKLGEHIAKGAANAVATAIITPIKEIAIGIGSHVKNEIGNKMAVVKESKNNASVRILKKSEVRPKMRLRRSVRNNENRINWNDSKGSATYQHLDAREPSADEGMALDTIYEEEDGEQDADEFEENDDEPDADEFEENNDELDADEFEPEGKKMKYVSEGKWISKMVVSYVLNGRETTQEVSGSGQYVTLPSEARRIEVRFQVRRPFWGDIIKYDRFEKCWCQSSEPHVFRYDTPKNRTFTISGNLWWEAVTHVSNKRHDEKRDS